MQERHINRKQYFEELAETSEKYFFPFLEQSFGRIEGCRVLEIGCGDGGNLLPFVKRGCQVTGIDMAPGRIEQAQFFFTELGYSPTLICRDIFEMEPQEVYDIIIVHDVIEHINRKKEFLLHIHRFMDTSGLLYIAFPAWQMPFGGHQQICHNRFLSRFPFIHLLPSFMYKQVLKWSGENERTAGELLDIKSCGLTIEVFRELVIRCNYKFIREEYYFINPHYEVKFGLRPVKLSGLFSSIPYLRNFYTSSCFYLLGKQ